MATSFQGTTTKCTACDKTVYLVDKLTADNRVYHKACFRCHHCKGTLKVKSTAVHSSLLLQSPVHLSVKKLTTMLSAGRTAARQLQLLRRSALLQASLRPALQEDRELGQELPRCYLLSLHVS
jgi:transposase-like protein